MKFIKIGIFTIVFAGFCMAYAHAQDRFPEFSLGGTLSDIEGLDESELIDYDIQTPLMNDILVLQEQISLLEALVERQGEISRIASSYENVGLEFKQPSPPPEACAKLPVNLLCLYAYPEMEKNIPVVEDQKERLIAQQQQAIEDAIASFLENNQPMTAQASSELGALGLENAEDFMPRMEQTIKQIYFWSDIQCLFGQCSALVVSALDDTERYRVKKGDSFGDDINVKDININGIKVAANDEDYFLSPMPLTAEATRSMQLDNFSPNTSGQDILRDLELESNQAQVAMPETPVTPTPEAESAPQGDLLGPTGLF
jgi:hypothetical protein